MSFYIKSSKAYFFVNYPDDPTKEGVKPPTPESSVKVTPNDVTLMPDWVRNIWLFQSAVADGSIIELVAPKLNKSVSIPKGTALETPKTEPTTPEGKVETNVKAPW